MNVYPVTVDYQGNFDELVAAGQYWSVPTCGMFRKAHPEVKRVGFEHRYWLENTFEVRGRGKSVIEGQLVAIEGKTMQWQDCISVIEQMGLRPAEAIELLSFGAQYPDHLVEQTEYSSIAALTFNPEPERGIPVLFTDYYVHNHEIIRKGYGIEWLYSGYHKFDPLNKYRFLAFPK